LAVSAPVTFHIVSVASRIVRGSLARAGHLRQQKFRWANQYDQMANYKAVILDKHSDPTSAAIGNQAQLFDLYLHRDF
jgi:hypothetical protein